MTQSEWQGTGGVAAAEYSYARRLGPVELATAGGVGLVAGLAVFYVARILAMRTALNEPMPTGGFLNVVPTPAALAARRADPEASLHPRLPG